MSFEHIILVAFIQGITEFLPISSSGHLVLIPNLTELPDQGRVFDVAVHFGSLCAVIIYLWHDLTKIILGFITFGSKSEKGLKLGIYAIIASLPLFFAGYFIQLMDIEWLRSLEIIAWTTLIFGILLFLTDNFFLRVKNLENLNFPSVIFIGLVQVIAFLPGTSRAGIVITACRILGFERKDAARFSLLLSVPAILGASTLELIELINSNNSELSWHVLYASILSFILSICSIFLMMKWLSFASFTPFVIYRIFLGAILLLAIYFW